MGASSMFVTVTANQDGLFALDDEGRVWKYIPAGERDGKKHYAAWVKLTNYRIAERAR